MTGDSGHENTCGRMLCLVSGRRNYAEPTATPIQTTQSSCLFVWLDRLACAAFTVNLVNASAGRPSSQLKIVRMSL